MVKLLVEEGVDVKSDAADGSQALAWLRDRRRAPAPDSILGMGSKDREERVGGTRATTQATGARRGCHNMPARAAGCLRVVIALVQSLGDRWRSLPRSVAKQSCRDRTRADCTNDAFP